MSWVREAQVNHGDPMVTALVLHSGHDVVGGNRGYPTLTVYDYWNCTGASALWCSWLPELPAALFEGGGVTTSCWLDHLRNEWMTLLFEQNPGHFLSESGRIVH